MIMTSDYGLDPAPDSDNFYVRSHEVPQCPACSAYLKSFGYRKRKVCRRDGSETHLEIRRLWCPYCRRVHHELPDFVIPYKRYDAEVIEDIICSASGSEASEEKTAQEETQVMQTSSDVMPPDYPCESSTALRLRIWFLRLLSNLERDRKIQSDILKVLSSSNLSLELLKEAPRGWLKRLFCVIIKIPLFS